MKMEHAVRKTEAALCDGSGGVHVVTRERLTQPRGELERAGKRRLLKPSV